MTAITTHVDTMPNSLMETPWIMMILLPGRLKRVGIRNRINDGQVLICDGRYHCGGLYRARSINANADTAQISLSRTTSIIVSGHIEYPNIV